MQSLEQPHTWINVIKGPACRGVRVRFHHLACDFSQFLELIREFGDDSYGLFLEAIAWFVDEFSIDLA